MTSFTGGEKLQSYLAQLAEKVRNASEVKVGFLSGSTYPDGTSVPMVAAINEFGAPYRGQPPRPFFRSMIAAKSGGWGKATADLLKANGNDAAKTLAMVGQGIEGQLRQSIVDTNSPPLAPSTTKKKGSAKPLVDTGHMLNSISSEVS